MNRIVLSILALLVIGSVDMNAQLGLGVIANVPFNFVAGYKSFPAGEYWVKNGPATRTITIQSRDGKVKAFALWQDTESLRPHADSSLVFTKYGDSYFLRQVWVQGNTSGTELLKTRLELQAEAKDVGTRRIIVASRSHR